MLQVLRLYPKDIDSNFIETVLTSAAAPFEVADTVLSRHFSWYKLANWLCTSAAHNFMYALYVDEELAGVMCFSEIETIHLNCHCVVEDLLYIRPEYRSMRSLFFLIKSALHELSLLHDSALVVVAGSTLGSTSLPSAYKRLGFSEAGTHLVIELNAQTKDSS